MFREINLQPSWCMGDTDLTLYFSSIFLFKKKSMRFFFLIVFEQKNNWPVDSSAELTKFCFNVNEGIDVFRVYRRRQKEITMKKFTSLACKLPRNGLKPSLHCHSRLRRARDELKSVGLWSCTRHRRVVPSFPNEFPRELHVRALLHPFVITGSSYILAGKGRIEWGVALGISTRISVAWWPVALVRNRLYEQLL